MDESIRFGCFYELSRFSRTQQLKLLRALSHYHLRVMAMSQSYGKYDILTVQLEIFSLYPIIYNNLLF